MKNIHLYLEEKLHALIMQYRDSTQVLYYAYRWRVLLAFAALCLLSSKNLDFTISINGQHQATLYAYQKETMTHSVPVGLHLGSSEAPAKTTPSDAPASSPVQPAQKAAPAPGSSQKGTKQQVEYIQRFAGLAQEEMRLYSIPASITLAQGILESSLGTSKLAQNHNNHFGIKCHKKSCPKGHCANFADDSHKDFFRSFATAWESYRAHSVLLVERKWYEALFQLPPNDYKAWARGLQSAGYATDPGYADKLIRLIESLELHRYDDIL